MPRLNQKGIAPLILIGIISLAVILGVWLVRTRTNILPHAQEAAKSPQTAFILTQKNADIPVLYGDPQQGSGSGVIIKGSDPIKPGDQFAVDLRVSSDIDTANTFYALIAFPQDLLEVVDIVKQSPGNPPFKHPKLDSILVQLIQEKDRGGTNWEMLAKNWGLNYKDGKVMVTLRVSPKFDFKTANPAQYGFEQTGSYENLVEGYAPIDSLYKLAEVEYVDYISAVRKPELNTNSVVNQSVSASGETGNTGRATGTQLIGPGCKVGGCSGQICQNESDENAITNCIYKSEYACYKNARCEKQSDGQCDWTQTDALQACLRNSPIPKPSPSCKPIPKCAYSNPACEIYIDPNDKSWCQPSSPVPGPSCKPRPACLDSEPRCLIPETDDMCPPQPKSPACETDADCKNGLTCQINPLGCNSPDPNSICNAPKTCQPAQRRVQAQDYFIQFWLPDTGFNNENGKIFLSGGTSDGLKTDPGEQPIMATIIFKAKKPGEAKLGFADDSLILRGGDSNNILTSKQGITINIQDGKGVKGDIDGDGSVGLRDFSILLSKWNSNDPKADLNGDGTVNLYDFSILLSGWTDKKK